MYRLSICRKQPVFFNSLEEFATKLFEDADFANDLFDTPIILQKTDNPDVFYNIECDRSSESPNRYPSDF
jgi:hypothetical protein